LGVKHVLAVVRRGDGRITGFDTELVAPNKTARGSAEYQRRGTRSKGDVLIPVVDLDVSAVIFGGRQVV
jgi:hypothetical protein